MRAPDESQARHRRLVQLGLEVSRHCPARLIRRHNGQWALTVGRETVYCAGAEGVYAYVTHHGLILSPANDEGITQAATHLAGGAAR
ncbi:hypothetical protein N5079_32540 [Planotetraspora sp. A-T 1434]|uniref:hypothetical protein n=1 Tax=Planotetraspora sp. A-T 1434 TaxID=2979219 RepID=UPI0021BEF5F7|nr:hypothetical protein [Planotetraspora sp. A-T 1434]MCT9934946.1 hypothetical protein [Planotetraspora sp. A-T 1434]